MRPHHPTAIAVLAGAAALLSSACGPSAKRWSTSRVEPVPCNGLVVLDVQNNLRESVEILEGVRSRNRQPAFIALLSPGAHTLEVRQDNQHWYAARTAGEKKFISRTDYRRTMQDPRVRLNVQCRPIR